MTLNNNRGPPGPTEKTRRFATEKDQTERNRREAPGCEIQNPYPSGRHEKPMAQVPG